MRIILKTYTKSGKLLIRYGTNNRNRFSQKLSLTLKKIDALKYYLKITYGRDKINEAYCNTKSELLKTYRAFTSPSLLEYMKQW